MKLFSITLILISVFGLLAYTNPNLDSYDQFIGQRITEETRKEKDPVAGALGSLLGGFAANLMTKQTVRKDYVFFSTYDTAFGKEHLRAFGVLNNFYITEDPLSKGGWVNSFLISKNPQLNEECVISAGIAGIQDTRM